MHKLTALLLCRNDRRPCGEDVRPLRQLNGLILIVVPSEETLVDSFNGECVLGIEGIFVVNLLVFSVVFGGFSVDLCDLFNVCVVE